MYLPEEYGNWRGVYNRLRARPADGTWECGITALMAQSDEEDGLDRVGVDGLTPRSSVTTSTLHCTWCRSARRNGQQAILAHPRAG
jgi:hypothetical protein